MKKITTVYLESKLAELLKQNNIKLSAFFNDAMLARAKEIYPGKTDDELKAMEITVETS